MIGRVGSCDNSLEKRGGGGVGFICTRRGPEPALPLTFDFLPPDLTCSPDPRQCSVYEARPNEQNILYRFVKPVDIVKTHCAIALAGLTKQSQEKMLGGCRGHLPTQPSCHEEVVHVPAACSNAR